MPGDQRHTISDLREQYAWTVRALEGVERPTFLFRFFFWIFCRSNGWDSRESRKQVSQARRRMNQHIGIIDAMTPWEREWPEIISFARQYRIAQGAGVCPSEVGYFLQHLFALKQKEREEQNRGSDAI
ncbi:hypothetical protein [Anatilimnocola floriformis]|uniref:hypothetical protein n=1 Tax=Anatilimnocola floriformis TaxID=2948575 RepID=UPI0020C43121|nr:hypothetical protein [Anatilimnocola floriformis]